MTTKLRVAVLRNPNAPWAHVLVNALASACDVVVIDRPPVAGPQPTGTDGIRRVAALSGTVPAQAIRLRKALAAAAPHVLLTLYAGSFAAIGWTSRFRPHVVYTMGSDVFGVAGLRRAMTRVVLRRADLTIANGQSLADATRSITRRPVLSIPHGISLRRFPFRPATAGPVRLLIIRGFAPVYNQQLVVRALSHLRPPDGMRVTFAAAGHEPAQAATRKWIPGSESWIRFLGGVPYDSMPAVMAAHTHYLSMSRHDGTSSSLLEAMASGLSPIVSDTAANREWIGPGIGHGSLVPLGDVAALTAAIEQAVASPPSAERLAANRALVEERGDITTNVERVVDALRGIVRGAGHR